jgi:hypothetical protein
MNGGKNVKGFEMANMFKRRILWIELRPYLW